MTPALRLAARHIDMAAGLLMNGDHVQYPDPNYKCLWCRRTGCGGYQMVGGAGFVHYGVCEFGRGNCLAKVETGLVYDLAHIHIRAIVVGRKLGGRR